MSPTTAPLQLHGSAWDVISSPAQTDPSHLAEWIERSAVHPALAAANVQTLAGADVLQALAGDRLEQLGAHAQQYRTAPVARLLDPLEPIAAAGGWWCSGLDPRADWAPMAWGCFKPDRPRLGEPRGFGKAPKTLKYEHPRKVPTCSFWLRVPAEVAQLVADRYSLPLPLEVAADHDGSAGAFWRWWAREPRLPLVITEGVKKAAALLSIGVPAVALPGIWNGCPRTGEKDPATGRRTGPRELLADLAAVPWADRLAMVLFDHSTREDPDEPKAARRLAALLQRAGARQALAGIVPGTHGKGADDHLAAGGSWEALSAALKPLPPLPALPRLRRADVVAPAGQFVGRVVPIPSHRRVVAFACPMGSGKTEAMAAYLAPLQAAGTRVVLITHRRSLGAALAERLGLPWADEAAPGSDLRQLGIALCIDSLCSSSRLRFNPADWRDCVVVMDEATAVLAHAVMGTETAIARRRVPVLQALGDLLADARQLLIADAQLDDATLQALEAAAGERAYLIGSDHRPAAGRQLVTYAKRADWYAALTPYLQRRQRLWVGITAATGPNGAQHLAVLIGRTWPGCRVLVVDSETVDDPEHDASRLAANPNGIAEGYDVVICTPAIAAGLSVTLRGHFAAVFVAAGGTTDPGAVAQAAGRVRDDCPRHLYAPDRSPGGHLRYGCGSVCPDRVMLHLQHHHLQAVGQLAAAGVNLATGTTGPWLPLWAQLAAHLNRARLTFRDTVTGILEREGYAVSQATADPGAVCPEMLQELAEMEKEAERERVIAAELLSDSEARKLEERRQRLTPAEKAQLQRWRIDRAWHLQGTAPCHALIAAHDDGAHRRVVFRWAVTDPAAAPLIAAHDRQQARQQAPDGRAWAPDLTRTTLGPRVTAAQALGLADWLARSDWFAADDPALRELSQKIETHTAAICQVLGVSLTGALGLKPGKRETTILRQLLALAGARLEARRVRSQPGQNAGRQYVYRVVVDPLAWRPRKGAPPLADRITPADVVTGWRAQLGADAVPKNPLLERRADFGTRDREAAAMAA